VLYGRDLERDRIGALIDAARASHSGALVLRGEPGIGKTALLEDAREQAYHMHVLAARGVESESELPFAALHQLLRPALHELDQLPPAQAEALRGALGLGDGSSQEKFLVFAGCLSLLSELAEDQPVLCLVDDAHWLDSASADALRFVARRLDAEGIVLLFAAREGEARTFEADVPSLQLHGLDVEAAAKLLTQRARVPTAPTVRDRLVEQTLGNALALIELPAALSDAQLAGDEPLPEPLPLTHQVESVFLERVRRLPDETQLLLLVIAADDSENAVFVARAGASLGVSSHALEAAEQAGLVSVSGTRLEFRHPLVRSAVYGAATSGARRAAHRAMATALADDEEQADRRAWHLASSTLEPDEEVVSALDHAAKRGEQRGAYMAAARALERAADLSSDEAARGRRLTGAARCASTAGADEHAVVLARRALRLVDDPGYLAGLRFVLGLAELRRGHPLVAVPLLIRGARELQPADRGRALELLLWATWAAWQAGDLAAQAETSQLAATFAPGSDDESAFVANLLGGFAAMLQADTAKGTRLLEMALDWAATADTSFHVFQAGMGAFWLGDDERFGALLNRAAALARERGQFGMLAEVLGRRAGQLALAQHYDQAMQAGVEAIELARELGADNLELLPRAILAFVSALRGEDDEARRQAADAFERGAAHGFPVPVAIAVYALAFLELSRGRWVESLEHLDALVDESGGADLFLATIGAPDRVEAAVRAGRPEQGQEALALFEGWATQAGARWAQPRLASCRALLAEGEDATEHFEEALQLRADSRPFDLARIRLLYGEHLRRERRPSDARIHLRAALEGFERFRAEPWAERARQELRATGETARKRDPSTLGQLTPRELQIARYVGDGLANKEIAAQMFLSKRTIDYHLRNVFVKLGISSRTQLAGLRLGDEATVQEAAALSV
jgi:DNA-binding CsgD family transcriptional regulator